MSLRALRLLPFPSTATAEAPNVAGALSFSSTLHLAAGRAWARRALIPRQNAAHGAKRAAHTSVPRCHESSSRTIADRNFPGASSSSLSHQVASDVTPRTQSVDRERGTRSGDDAGLEPPPPHRHRDTRPKKPPEPEFPVTSSRHTHRTTSAPIPSKPPSSGPEPFSDTVAIPVDDPMRSSGTPTDEGIPPNARPPGVLSETTASPIKSAPPPPLSPPDSPSSMYDNMVHILIRIKGLLPKLIAYHDFYPQYHSTATYNLLLNLAIRHQSHGTVAALLSALEKAGIEKDLETYALAVRSLVQQGDWNGAWDYAQKLKDSRVFPSNAKGQTEIPFPIWVELCRGHPTHLEKTEAHDSRSVSKVSPDELVNRQRLIRREMPSDTPDLATTPPYAVLSIVQLLLRSKNHAGACSLTKAYFSTAYHNYLAAQQPMFSRQQKDAFLRIMHLLMARIELVSESQKPAMRFLAAERLLLDLLEHHPVLKPSPLTIFVMLSRLKGAARCGTLAWKHVQLARERWGDDVVDATVLRRCVAFALKEKAVDVLRLATEELELVTATPRQAKRMSGPEGDPSTVVTEKVPSESVNARALHEAVSRGVSPTKLPLNRIMSLEKRDRLILQALMGRLELPEKMAAIERRVETKEARQKARVERKTRRMLEFQALTEARQKAAADSKAAGEQSNDASVPGGVAENAEGDDNDSDLGCSSCSSPKSGD